jgi:FAD/FMN-containing dehydrogenase
MVIDTLHFHPVEELARRLSGELIAPDDRDYDAARRVFNGAVDRRPAAVVRPVRNADVQASVRWARERGVPIAVRGGGADPAGGGVIDGGLVIDLYRMRGIDVDAGARTVRVGGGVTWGELDRATQAHGLATPGARVPDVGVAGFVLSGGHGWLSSAYGLGADNLLAATLVTAEGDVVRASADENPDLLTALGGGGAKLGVVVDLTLRLHAVGPSVLAGGLFFDAAQAADVLTTMLDADAGAPDTVSLTGGLWSAPPAPWVPASLRGEPMASIGFCSFGDAADGEAALARLRSELEPAVDMVTWQDYASFQAFPGATNPAGLHAHWTSQTVEALPEPAIESLVAHGLPLPSPLSEVAVVPLRGTGALVLGMAKWAYPAPAVAAAHRRWADEVAAGLSPWARDEAFPGTASDEHPQYLFG